MNKQEDVLTLEMEATTPEIKDECQKILKKFGLDFHIIKMPNVGHYETEDNGLILYPTKSFGLFNSKTREELNTVKAGYRVSQNDEVVELVLRGIAGFGNLKVKKAGALHGGRKVFIQLELSGVARVGNDNIVRYITIIDSNDGSTGLSVGIGDLTMSCQNQFFKFYKAGQMKMRHCNSMDEKIKELPNLITLALTESMKLVNAYKQLTKTPITEKLIHELVNDQLGIDRVVNKKGDKVTPKAQANMENLYLHLNKEIADKGMNLWGLHSGVTSWTTHKKQAPKRANGRIESSMVGTNYKNNQKSLAFVLKKAGITL